MSNFSLQTDHLPTETQSNQMEERKQHLSPLNEWNDTQVNYPEDLCIHELFEAAVERSPFSVAAVFEGESLTYQELNRRANQLAHYLRILGVKPDTPVGICVERSLEMVVGILGILKAGGAYVPLDPAYPLERLAFMVKDAQVGILLTQNGLVKLVSEYRARIVCLDADWEIIAQQSQENPNKIVTPDNLAYGIYTSGSTGRPKGVAMSQRPLSNLLFWQLGTSTLSEAAKTLQFAPIGFDVAFQEMFSTWCSGGTLVLISEEMRRDAIALLHFLIKEEIERLFLPFVALQQLAEIADSQETVPSSLREIVTAGEQLKITRQIANLFAKLKDCTLHNHYGPSESHVVTAFTLTGSPQDWPALPPIGRPIANTQIYLLDEQMQPVPVGVPGELYIGGIALAQGYLNQPELTREKFIRNPFQTSRGAGEQRSKGAKEDSSANLERLYKTGDLARYLPDGNIEYVGRIDNQVKIRGFRIELGEIEAVLSQYPAVIQTAVAVREDIPGHKSLVAYLVPNQEQAPTLSDLRHFLKEKLPEYMVPDRFAMLESLPLTPTGKIDRRALPAPNQTRPAIAEFVAPRTRVEEVLAGIWAEVLGLEQVGIHDNFFELGGHSLLGVQIVSRLRCALQVEIPLRTLFESPTVAELGSNLETNCLQQAPPIVPVLQRHELPLSFPQQQMWLFAQLQPHLPYHNSLIALRLPGQVNVIALEKALNEIIKRHEAWRTNFSTIDGLPVQVIQQPSTLSLPVVDLRELPQTEREAKALQLATEQVRRPFNLSSDLLLRSTLMQLSDSECRLFLTLHHIIYDGLSLNNVFFKELETLYQAFCAGKTALLPSLPVQYADFAVWQRQWLQPQILEPHLAYWKQQLANLPFLQLPTDRPRPACPTFKGAREYFTLSEAITEKLKVLARRESVTLFVTLQAAFKTLLHRYTGQDDIPAGIVVAGSERPEIAGLIGCFVNFLVLRTDLSDNPSFRQLLLRVRETLLEAHAHKDMPFEQLVKELQPEQRLSQNPLYQVMLLLNPPLSTLNSGWTIDRMDGDNGTARCDLTVELNETPKGLFGFFEYSTELFDAATVQRMARHFSTLLEGIVANPEQKLSDLPLLTPHEQQELEAWNHTKVDYPQNACLHQIFEAQVEKTPDAIALVFGGEQLTYRSLNQRANQLAHHLKDLGVKPEVLVGICMERSLEMAVGVLGILKAGGAYVPLDPAYPKERLAFMLADTQVPVLLTQQSLVEQLPEHTAQVVCLDTDWEKTQESNQENLFSDVTPDNLAYVIYTSGSTGKPKGICLAQRPLINLLEWHFSCLSQGARTLQFASLSFDASFHEMFATWGTGGTLFVISDVLRTDAVGLGRYLAEQAIEKVILPGVVLQQLAESVGEPGIAPLHVGLFAQLREVTTTGEQLRITPEIVNLFKSLPNCSFHNHYGPSETHVVTALTLSKNPDEWSDHPPIGTPIANTQIYLVDKHFNQVPVGVPGELCIGGVSLARGYLNQPDLTSEKFIPNPLSSKASDRLYKTGDLARYLPDGNIEYIGRIDHQVKIRGFRIELGEIEAVLWQHPEVRDAVAIARSDVPGDKRLVAYIVSDLPARMPYQSACLAEFEENCTVQLHTEDISTGGVCVRGVPATLPIGSPIRLYLQLPGSSYEQWLEGRVAWHGEQQAGIQFAIKSNEQALLRQSVKYLLKTQGFLKIWQRTMAGNLRSFLKEKLPDYMVPSSFVILDALPLTPNGKVDRRALPAPNQTERVVEESLATPRTPIEEVLVEIWSEVLRLKRVGIHNNFLELGGHSLLAAQINSRLRHKFQVELPLRQIFEAATIAELAREIEKLQIQNATEQALANNPSVKEAASPTEIPSEIAPISRQAHRIKRSSLK